MCNKGDSETTDVRCRLVSCEIKKHKGDKPPDLFANTPPLEAQRMMFSRCASERVRCKGKVEMSLQIICVDIRNTDFNGIPRRLVYIHIPREKCLGTEYVAKQVRCVYGTRDAGSNWEDCYRDCLEEIGFLSGAALPCVCFHPERNISVVVHGDDFTALEVSDDLS